MQFTILLLALVLATIVDVTSALKCLIKNENSQLVSQDFGSIAQACVYIKYPCMSSQDPYCANRAAGSLAEVYSVWDDKNCSGFQDLASYYKDLICCATDDCNNPAGAGFVDISAAGRVSNTVPVNNIMGGGIGRPSVSDAQSSKYDAGSWLGVAAALVLTVFQLF